MRYKSIFYAFIYLLGLLGADFLQAQSTLQSLSSAGTQTSLNLARTSIATLRTEFSIENLAVSSIRRQVWGLGPDPGHFCQILPNSLVLVCQVGGDGTPDGIPTINLAGRTSVRIRWQRDTVVGTFTLEAWDGNCQNYSKAQNGLSSVRPPFDYTGPVVMAHGMRLGFLRFDNRIQANGSCPVDAPDERANLLDLRFESLAGTPTPNDVSGRNQSLTLGGAVYVPSQTYPPIVNINGGAGGKPSFRAGETFELDGSASVVFSGNGRPAAYTWQQICDSGDECTEGQALTSRLQNANSARVRITAPVAGEYLYQLTIKDHALANDGSAISGVKRIAVGIVATDKNYVTSLPNKDHSWVLGNIQLYGKSPWPWLDVTESAVADALRPVMTIRPRETPGAGTVQALIPQNTVSAEGYLTQGNASVNGTAVNGILWQGNNTNFTSADVGKVLAIHWDADNDNAFSGRRVVSISQVFSPTSFSTHGYQLHGPSVAFTSGGVAWSYLDESFGPYNVHDARSNNAMFYEAGLAIARLQAKTGLRVYQSQLHAFCDNWWRYALNSGYEVPIPRNAGIHSMIACAIDPDYPKPANMWSGLARVTQQMATYIKTTAGSELAYNPTTSAVKARFDARENSYVLRSTALLARLYGKTTGSQTTTATWCGYLKNQVKNIWLATAVAPNGATPDYAMWGEDLYSDNPGYVSASSPAGSPTGSFGTSPWRSAGLPNLALTYAYEALKDLNDNQGCSDEASLALSLLDPQQDKGLISRVANYIWDYGRSPDGGVLYAEGYETGNYVGSTVYNSQSNGALAVTQGSTLVTGNQTYFKSQFGCDGVNRIRILQANYVVASCASDTQMTLATPYTGNSDNYIGNYGNPATIGVVSGSSIITGSGSNFLSLFAPCDGSTYIAVEGTVDSGNNRRIYRVMSCQSNTQLTINLPYAGATESAISAFARGTKALTRCGPLSVSGRCEPDGYNGRNLSSDIAASAAWLSARNYDAVAQAKWRERALYYANKTFGGAAGGSGSIGSPTGSCVYNRPGTISVTSGGTTVTGNGTQFTRQFGPCNGSTRILIGDSGGSWAKPPNVTPNYYYYAVRSCTETSLELASAYEGASRNGTGLFYSPEDKQWNCADGGTGNLGEVLPFCNNSPPPCGGNALVPKYGKSLGMASGAGDTPVMIANLFGGLLQQNNGSLYLEFDLSLILGAVKARIVVTQPDKTVRTTICETSPCTLAVNLQLGNPVIKIEYLDSSGLLVLSTGEPRVWRFVTDEAQPQAPLQIQPQ